MWKSTKCEKQKKLQFTVQIMKKPANWTKNDYHLHFTFDNLQ